MDGRRDGDDDSEAQVSDMADDITERDLHAYVDNQLAPDRRALVEAHLATHADAASRVRAYQQQNDGLRLATRAVLDEPVPPALKANARRRRFGAMRVAAAMGWVALGAVVGWFGRSGDVDPAPLALAQQAAVAHAVYAPEVLHPVEVSARQEAHLVKWLSKRLGDEVRPPRLSSVGFDLVGGRLLPSDIGPAAQFMYQNADGQRLTLYIHRTRDSDSTAFRYAREGQVSVFYWMDGPLAYALAGETERARLLEVAELVYRDLNR